MAQVACFVRVVLDSCLIPVAQVGISSNFPVADVIIVDTDNPTSVKHRPFMIFKNTDVPRDGYVYDCWQIVLKNVDFKDMADSYKLSRIPAMENVVLVEMPKIESCYIGDSYQRTMHDCLKTEKRCDRAKQSHLIHFNKYSKKNTASHTCLNKVFLILVFPAQVKLMVTPFEGKDGEAERTWFIASHLHPIGQLVKKSLSQKPVQLVQSTSCVQWKFGIEGTKREYAAVADVDIVGDELAEAIAAWGGIGT